MKTGDAAERARGVPREERMLACGRAHDPRVAHASKQIVDLIEEVVGSGADRVMLFSHIRELVDASVASEGKTRKLLRRALTLLSRRA